MNLSDTGRVLALASGYDNRKLDETVAVAWHAIIGDLDFTDCCHVVRDHYARSRDWLMPADIRDGVRRLRNDRLARTPDPVPAIDPDRPREFIHAVRETRRAIADGQHPPPERLRLEGARGLPDGFVETFRDVREQHRPAQREAPAATEAERLAEQQARAEIAALHQAPTAAEAADQPAPGPLMESS
jgi:hypothetical protein